MNNAKGLFESMVKEATEEVANHGWKNASQNAVTLAAFGMMVDKVNNRVDRIIRPAWVIALSALGTAIWFIISKIFGMV